MKEIIIKKYNKTFYGIAHRLTNDAGTVLRHTEFYLTLEELKDLYDKIAKKLIYNILEELDLPIQKP